MRKKIAVLADIHSNHIALETCLKEAQERGAQDYLFLGDYLGELAYDCLFLLEHQGRR